MRTVRAGIIGGSFLRICSGSVPFLLPLMLQLGFGMNPLQSGLLTCASAAGAMFMKTFTERVLRAWNFRRVLMVSTVVSSVLMCLIGLFSPETPKIVILGLLTVVGCFRSLQYTSVNGIAYSEVDKLRMSQATSMSAMGQQLSQGLGVTFGAGALQAAMALRGVDQLGVQDFMGAFVAAGAVGLFALFFFAELRNSDGAEVSGYRRQDAIR